MEEKEKYIHIKPHKDPAFAGECAGVPCACCNHNINDDLFDIDIRRYYCRVEEYKMTLCKECLGELLSETAHVLHKSVKVNDTVWELVLCDDNVWRIFPMVVKSVSMYGSVRWVKTKEPTVWNIYAESDDTCMYKSFYDTGTTLFFTEEDARKALRKKNYENLSDKEWVEVINLNDLEVFETFVDKAKTDHDEALAYLSQWDQGEDNGEPEPYNGITGKLSCVHTIMNTQYMALWQAGIEAVTLYRAFKKK